MAGSNIADRTDESDGNPGAPRRQHWNLRDISKQWFGRWLVIDRAKDVMLPSGRRRTTWNCVCTCGYKARIRKSNLISGRSQSCGCLKSELAKKNPPPTRKGKTKVGKKTQSTPLTAGKADLTGELIGRWRVEQRVADQVDRAGQRRQTWACVCECGARKDVRGSDLRQGKSRSCGCLRREVLPEARRLARLRRQVAAVDAAF